MVSQLLIWSRSPLTWWPQKMHRHALSCGSKALELEMTPSSKRETRGKTGRTGTKINPVIFSYVGVFMNSHCLSLKKSDSFKTAPFSLKVAHRILLTHDLRTNTSLQMHCQRRQAMHAFPLRARSCSLFNHYYRYILHSDWVKMRSSLKASRGICSGASTCGRQHGSPPLQSPSRWHWKHSFLKGWKHQHRWARKACFSFHAQALFGESPAKFNAFKYAWEWGWGRN